MTRSESIAPGTAPEPPLCQSPDASPVAPGFELPELACDCHAHIYGPPERYPYRENRRYTPAPVGLAQYRQALDMLGIRRAVIVQPTIYHDNQATLDVLQEMAGQWRGIAKLKADVSDAELTRLDVAGFRGVRLHAGASIEEIDAMARRVAPLGWHLQLHLNGRELALLGARLTQLPVDVVIDHFGRLTVEDGIDQPAFRGLLAMLETGRCWVKLSAPFRLGDPVPPYAAVAPYARAMIATRPDRLVWGSDWPHASFKGTMPNMGVLLGLLSEWAPDAHLRNQILSGNPARLYRF
ncbi:amidohydrolase family protein [Paraburkholderia xenovorans LB400]|uniref:Hydrolase n=1 Tax=Paraburkholderia xenovorans (strain LB400) TaxID=266265 RepID=Q13H81_PARXL|nr:amidohydrolase family protein [Paraburkholderia xenovorans]ABE36558.1 Putative hydrolase [Paraburkholderia xenovorans LB400]AIP34301.1 amidohydrolase family protein [Paraburkholderia xenovorans LB400]